jgi:three-Cys-motif partner protein
MTKPHYDWKMGKPLPKIGAHSLAKHRILQRYIERYIEIVTAISFQEQLSITFVDGYSGGGRYSFGRDEVPGSPLILLHTVAAMEAKLSASRPKGFKINAEYIFIDVLKAHTDFLRNEIESSPFKPQLDKTIHIWTADFNERVSDAVAIAKKRSPRAGRAIFLLDQYGWSKTAFSSIRKILVGLQKAEVFLTFSVDSLINYLSDRSFDMRAFGEIDMDPAFVKELLRIKETEQGGARVLIQNVLYEHIQESTEAPFYSPFFIKSPQANRSYWFIHLSKHREARNEIGMIHWQENNTTVHNGGAGLHALGFATGADPNQLANDFLFDDHARLLSRTKLLEQLPRIIHQAADADAPPSLEDIFSLRCNDTPVVRDLLEEAILSLRDEKEISVVDSTGKPRPRTNSINWSDKVVLPPQRRLFGPFSKLKAGDAE